MLIADIGEVVQIYQDLVKLDAAVDNVKAGRLNVSINGNGMGNDMRDACSDAAISFLRSQRAAMVQRLMKMGYEE